MASVGGPKYNTHHTPTQPLHWDKDTPQAEGTFLEFLPSSLIIPTIDSQNLHAVDALVRYSVEGMNKLLIARYVYKHPIIQFYFKSEAFNVYTHDDKQVYP